MSENDSTQLIEAPNFSEFINTQKYLPHDLLFINNSITSEEKENYNFLYAILYLLTNNGFLMEHFLSLNASEDNKVKIFYNLISKMFDCIKINNDMNETNNQEKLNNLKKDMEDKMNQTVQLIRQFKTLLKKDMIFEKKYLRTIIMQILVRTLKQKNLDKSNSLESSEGKSSSDDLIKTIIESLKEGNTSEYSVLENSLEKSYMWSSEYESTEIYNKTKDIIIKTTDVDGNEKYRYSSFFTFNLEEDIKENEIEREKVYRIEDCFINYLNEIKIRDKQKKIKTKVYFKLPESIIIILYFGITDYPPNSLYDFEEIIDFSKEEYAQYLDESIRNKKYILSSLIACKFPNQPNEFFYTFCRNSNNKFYMYHNKDDEVSENENVVNKLKKTKIVKKDGNTSYPYALIYDEIKDEKEKKTTDF